MVRLLTLLLCVILCCLACTNNSEAPDDSGEQPSEKPHIPQEPNTAKKHAISR